VPTPVISADSQVMEPPTLWMERLDRRWPARAPRVVSEWKGKKGELLICDDRLLRPAYGGFPAAKPLHEIPPYPQSAHPRERTGYADARAGGGLDLAAFPVGHRATLCRGIGGAVRDDAGVSSPQS
jgi:hypothetical protein